MNVRGERRSSWILTHERETDKLNTRKKERSGDHISWKPLEATIAAEESPEMKAEQLKKCESFN